MLLVIIKCFLSCAYSATRIRMAGIKGLQGVVRKTVNDELQANIWDPQHMDKIVPSLLFNLQSGERTERWALMFFLLQMCQNMHVGFYPNKKKNLIKRQRLEGWPKPKKYTKEYSRDSPVNSLNPVSDIWFLWSSDLLWIQMSALEL